MTQVNTDYPGLGGLVLIADQLLSSNSSFVLFSSIPQIYKHLKLICTGRLTTVATADNLRVQFNGDVGANYDYEFMVAVGALALSSGSVFGAVFGSFGAFPAANSARSTQAGFVELTIPDYKGVAFEKTGFSVSGASYGTVGNTQQILSTSIAWRSAAAIDAINISLASGQFSAGSMFSLYGLN